MATFDVENTHGVRKVNKDEKDSDSSDDNGLNIADSDSDDYGKENDAEEEKQPEKISEVSAEDPKKEEPK